MKCRHCGSSLDFTFLDLGSAPPSNSYLTDQTLFSPEMWFPLRILVCENCWLVQTEDFADREVFFNNDYAYFSSFSTSWLEHSKKYVNDMISRFALDRSSLAVEIACNDGYLLQYVKEAGIRCFGVEPASGTAKAAAQRGIDVVESFFGRKIAEKLVKVKGAADLVTANNVLAHVPDINDFVSGFTCLLKPDGVATFEFPHILRMVTGNQFDTAYHEHYSYLSLTAVSHIFTDNGLSIFDVEEIPTHGGSLRVFAQRTDSGNKAVTMNVQLILDIESCAGVSSRIFYSDFQSKAEKVKNDLLSFLIESKKHGLKVSAYGAAAKGNTLLNFAGVRPDLLSCVVDRNPVKQGRYMPGSRIPIVSGDLLKSYRPDFLLLLPWNLRDELVGQLSHVTEWGCRFVVAVPELEII